MKLEELNSKNTALLVHHPIAFLRCGGEKHLEVYEKVVEFTEKLNSAGLKTIYFAYSHHLDELFLNETDFFIIQGHPKSRWLRKTKKGFKNQKWAKISKKNFESPKELSSKTKKNLEKIQKDRGCIVYSHQGAARELRKYMEKQKNIEHVLLIGGPVDGCLPENFEHMEKKLANIGVDIKLMDGKMIVCEKPETKLGKHLDKDYFVNFSFEQFLEQIS